MDRRIPDKATNPVAYLQYWRDGRLLDEFNRLIDAVDAAAASTQKKRIADYDQAVAHLKAARDSFRTGWEK